MPNETPRQDDHQCENIVQPVATRSTARAAAVSQLVRTSADRPQHGGVDVLGDPLHRWEVDRGEQPGDDGRTRQQPGATGGTDVTWKRALHRTVGADDVLGPRVTRRRARTG
jgi:hypothetical protein